MILEEMKSLSEDKQKELYNHLKAVRSKAKKVNFSSLYGAGTAKISLTANIPLGEAKLLHTTYWIRNKAVKQVADACIVKTINNQIWLFNPISQFWYSLRSNKDKFSTLNQSSGTYCFDTWIRYIRKAGIKICGQFHDEAVIPTPMEEKENLRSILIKAIDDTNKELQLNVKLGISIDFGLSYAEIH